MLGFTASITTHSHYCYCSRQRSLLQLLPIARVPDGYCDQSCEGEPAPRVSKKPANIVLLLVLLRFFSPQERKCSQPGLSPRRATSRTMIRQPGRQVRQRQRSLRRDRHARVPGAGGARPRRALDQDGLLHHHRRWLWMPVSIKYRLNYYQ